MAPVFTEVYGTRSACFYADVNYLFVGDTPRAWNRQLWLTKDIDNRRLCHLLCDRILPFDHTEKQTRTWTNSPCGVQHEVLLIKVCFPFIGPYVD